MAAMKDARNKSLPKIAWGAGGGPKDNIQSQKTDQ